MTKRKIKRQIKIDFPEATGNYWRCVWIDQVYYQRKQRKIEVYFYNTESFSDKIFNPQTLYKTKIPISNLSEFGIGSIYNVEERKFEELNYEEIFRITIKENLYLAKAIEFPINGCEDFITNANEVIPIGFKYLKTFGKSNFRNSHILISPYTILQYFLFYNDRLINKVMSGRLVEGFDLKDLKFRKCEETNMVIGMLRYDAEMLTKGEASIIAPYLFLKNNAGIKFLKSLYSHIEKSFLNTLGGNMSSHLSFNWQDFQNYNIDVVGKTYNKDSKTYLLAYRICNFTFNDSQPYIVDKIELFPFNAKDSTEDRKNHEEEDIDKPGDPDIEGVSLNLNADSAKPIPPINTPKDEQLLNPFNIQVDVIKRDKQLGAYRVNYLPNDLKIDDLTRDIENFDNESKDLIENIKIIIAKAGNFEYFKVLIKIMEKEFLSEDSKFKLKLISHYDEGISFYIAEIIYQSKAIYLVEFGSGIIGLFSSIGFNILETEFIYALVKEFIKKEPEVEPGKVLWTYIKNEFEKYYEKKGIILYTGAKHLNKPDKVIARNKTEALEAAARRTAENIYLFRIKRFLI